MHTVPDTIYKQQKVLVAIFQVNLY